MINYKSVYKNLGDDFFKKDFNIPIYQRLYVWENIQVKTLIDDLVRAFEYNEQHEYYLGGIVVVENGNYLDLIDGQQRFTTLKILRELLGETGFTLDFQIRDNVWNDYKSENHTNDSDIERMIKAKVELEAGLNRLKDNKRKEFLKYLQEQVKLIVTIVPNHSDLNKLFELINGRGEQLQQHEILKAKLLSKVEGSPYKYGKIWDMFANMEDFLEINIKKSLGVSWSSHKFNENFNCLLEKIEPKGGKDSKSNQSEKPPTISNIISKQINSSSKGNDDDNENDKEDEGSTQYLSIISFELFLLYALVSFEKINYFEKMKDKNIEFKDKNLIQIFEIVLLGNIDEKKDITFDCFIQHLFDTRVKFDNYIIKNHKSLDDNSNETNHIISKVSRDENGQYVSRKVENFSGANSLELLQSMLYHSHTRNTQEWIIPFLVNIKNDSSVADALVLLKSIDNVLYSQFNTTGTLLERANNFNLNNSNVVNCKNVVEYLEENPEDSYHQISHYWFYKMDWIIWDLSSPKDDKFKFTARNSIEHIGPQNPQDENIEQDKVDKLKNSFGNLFLISVSQNSSVGNNGFHTKKAMFKDKEVKNLKLSLLSKYNNWGDEGAKKHFEECISMIKTYFNCNGINNDPI